MKKFSIRRAAVVIASVVIASAMAVPTMAATTYPTVEDNNNGKYSYVAKLSTIYKVNMEKRTFKKIKTLKGVTDVSDISYYGGYLYFTENRYKGSDMSCDSIYRMKTNGKSLKKLVTGSQPVIMGKKIYYVATVKHGSGGDAYTTPTGISRMSLSGKSKKKLLVNDKVTNLACASGRIRYKTSDDIYSVKTLKPDGTKLTVALHWNGNSPIIYSNTNKLLAVYPYTTYLQTLTDEKGHIEKINDKGYIPTGSLNVTEFVGNYGFYRSNSVKTGILYMFPAKKGAKAKKVKKLSNGTPLHVLAVNKGAIVLTQTYTKTKKYAIYIMKTNGKGYRIVTTYYHW